MVIGVWVSPEVALGGFHSQAGWLAFIAISLTFVAVTQRWSFFRAAEAGVETGMKHNPAAPYLAPLAVIFGTAMICAAFASGFDRFYALRVLAAAGVLWYFRKTYAAWRWTWNWGAFAIGVAVFAVWMAVESVASKSTSADPLATGLLNMPTGWTAIWLIFRIVGAVVTVPLAEELAFRAI